MKPKKRKLSGITFDFTGAHLAYTDASQGGAASGYNDPILLKSVSLDVSPEQIAILKEIEEELTPLDKNKGVSGSDDAEQSTASDSKQNTPSTSASAEAVMAGDDKKVLEGNTKAMSEQDEMIKALQEQVAKMARETAIEKAKNSLHKYSFDAELSTSLAEAFASLDDAGKDSVTKAFDTFVAQIETKTADLTKALEVKVESAQEAIVKAAQAATSVEVGHSAAVEKVIEKSEAEIKAEKIAEAYKAQVSHIQKGSR